MDEAAAHSDPLKGLEIPQFYAWHELTVAGLILMDLAWMVPWFQALASLRSPASPRTTFFFLGGIILGAHLFVRLMNFFRLRLPVRRVILTVYSLLACVAVLRYLLYARWDISLAAIILRPFREFFDLTELLPVEFVVVLTVIFAIWRGLVLAQDYLGPLRVAGSFRLGFVMFLLYVLFISLPTGADPVIQWPFFLFASLFAVGAARLAVLRLLRGGQRVKFELAWFIGLLLAIGGTIAAAALVALIMEGIAPLAIGILARLVLALVVLLISPILLLFVLALTWLLDRLQLEDLGLFESLTLTIEWISDFLSSIAEFVGDYAWILAELQETWLRWGPYLRLAVCSSILIVAAVLVINRLASKRRASDRDMPDEQEDLVSSEKLLGLLKERLLERLQGLGGLITGRARLGRGPLAAARIRQIYAELIDLAASLAHPRQASQTPLEYQKTLNTLFTGLEPQIDRITRAYIRVRYGEFPERLAEVDEIETAWLKVKAEGKTRLAGIKTRLKAVDR